MGIKLGGGITIARHNSIPHTNDLMAADFLSDTKGDIGLGLNKIKTTDIALSQEDPDTLAITDHDRSFYKVLRSGVMITGGVVAPSGGDLVLYPDEDANSPITLMSYDGTEYVVCAQAKGGVLNIPRGKLTGILDFNGYTPTNCNLIMDFALNATTTPSGDTQPIDRDLTNSKVYSNIVASSYTEFWRVDMGSTYDIAFVCLKGKMSGATGFNAGIKFERSPDGATWATIAECYHTATRPAADEVINDMYLVVNTARYIRCLGLFAGDAANKGTLTINNVIAYGTR